MRLQNGGSRAEGVRELDRSNLFGRLLSSLHNAFMQYNFYVGDIHQIRT